MGAVEASKSAKGKTMTDAWREVCERDRHFHGADPYSGGIHLCDFSGDKTQLLRSLDGNESKWFNEVMCDIGKREAVGARRTVEPDEDGRHTFIFAGLAPY